MRLIWHRRDLRLHDNALYHGTTAAIMSLYVMNPKALQKGWMGPHAVGILRDSVIDLRNLLEERGNTLIFRTGDPFQVVPQLVAEFNIQEVCWHEEPGVYEQQESDTMRQILSNRKIRVLTDMTYTLYHPNDLPRGDWIPSSGTSKRSKKKKAKETFSDAKVQAPLPQGVVDTRQERWIGIPRIMGDFRKVASKCHLRPSIVAPTSIKTIACNENGNIPSLNDWLQPIRQHKDALATLLKVTPDMIDQACDFALKVPTYGGEREALQRLEDFVTNHAAAADRSLAEVSHNQSSRFSQYLAVGALSPRLIVERVNSQQDCSWLASHMSMRDFFLYTCLASGIAFYSLKGIPISNKNTTEWRTINYESDFLCWVKGKTGFPLVDAAMRELMQTGYCSNRVRQNAASFLTKDLQIDWRMGAKWFQFLLADHCVGANWGNWLYFSGVGPDPKQRHFRSVSQALRYDPKGSYVRKWVPELSSLDGDEAHLRPWDYSAEDFQTLVPPTTQYTWVDLKRLEESGFLFAVTEDCS